MSQNLEKLKTLLAELFMLDRADLDFGIFRIMNQKHDEIMQFLDKDLLPQVQEAFTQYRSSDKSMLEDKLQKAVAGAEAAGFDPDQSPKVQDLREELSAYTVDITQLENEVFSDLYSFFRRYYHNGDFLSLRRYKAGVYAIPYEGEEVKLHWANADQYYIKSSEYLRDYTFKLDSGSRVHFKLTDADVEKDNVKAAAGTERRFILSEENPVQEENGELFIRFEYRPDTQKRKQEVLNQQAVESILSISGFAEWVAQLSEPSPTPKNPKRTLLEKHLTDYTARNTFDYFIHKDLGGFLRRELDFYIKNEIMHLDDIEEATAPRVEQYLSKIRVIRRIAHKIIDFLAQLEEFQKKLWLKKKFVVETNYCITLDRVPEELYPAIAANDAQRQEWVRLFAIDEITPQTITENGQQMIGDETVAYSESLTVEFLKDNPYLVLDTKFFDDDFKTALIASIDNLDEQCDGLLIHSENFQALNLLQERYREQVKCVYIDPPYNTSENTFLYKNAYKHSSWMSMMANSLTIVPNLLNRFGVLMGAIDDTEYSNFKTLLSNVFGEENYVGTVSVEVNPAGQNIRPNVPARSHDYFHIFSKHIEEIRMIVRSLTSEEQKQYKE